MFLALARFKLDNFYRNIHSELRQEFGQAAIIRMAVGHNENRGVFLVGDKLVQGFVTTLPKWIG
jgi:hypothetical protein